MAIKGFRWSKKDVISANESIHDDIYIRIDDNKTNDKTTFEEHEEYVDSKQKIKEEA